jgi:hypothetical protein
MKKVIRLTESDLTRIIQRVINETTDSNGGKKCYDEKNYNYKKSKFGNHLLTKKIVAGDTWSEIQQMTDDKGQFILVNNKFCDVKNPKVGEIIMYTNLPTM